MPPDEPIHRIRPGALALVVGPSGAGKDTLIAEARRALAGDARFVFATRVVTRPADAGGEAHTPATLEAFAAAEAAGQFLLSWRSHGLAYGIPAGVAADLARGRVVIANVSRTAITRAEALVERVAVLVVTAPLDVLAERIAGRGRESADDVRRRLARTVPVVTARAAVVEIDNAGEIGEAARRFTAALAALADHPSIAAAR